MKKHLFPILFAAFFVKSCDKPETVPAFLTIQKIEQTDATDEKITAAWVYVDNEFFGAFPLPAKIPVLKSGSVEVQVFAGVVENGDFSTPNIHPILKKWTSTVTLTEGVSTAISPTTSLETAAKQPLEDDFEGSTRFSEDLDGDLVTKILLQDTGVFAGLRSARIDLDTSHPLIEVASVVLDGLPTDGQRQCWLEIVYKNEIPFQFGLAGSDGGKFEQSVFQSILNQKTGWTKMYINVTLALQLSNFEKYKLTIRAQMPKDAAGKPLREKASIWLDNVRLIHL